MKNIAAWGTGGLILLIILFLILRSALSDMTKGVGTVMSALLLPASAREKHARLANRIAADKTIDDEDKARAYAFALCQPFSALSEFHISDPSIGISFWNNMQASDNVTSMTRDAMNDLVFVENLQLCLASNSYMLSGDSRIERMISVANDSPSLLEVAKIIRTEAKKSDWLKKLIGRVASEIREKAPALAGIMTIES